MIRFTIKIILLLQVVFLAACITDLKSNNLAFDAEKWKSGDMRTKGRMANNLQKSDMLIGKTKTEIEKLLGKDETSNSPNSWEYQIDFGYGVGTYSWTYNFKVIFDEQTEKVIFTYSLD